jgi:hypothetical protein
LKTLTACVLLHPSIMAFPPLNKLPNADEVARLTGIVQYDKVLKNNAALDRDGIASLAKSTLNPAVNVVAANEAALPSYFHVRYVIEIPQATGIMLTIQSFGDFDAAMAALNGKLCKITSDLDRTARKSGVPLGQVSLQVGKELQWVRDCLLIQIGPNNSQSDDDAMDIEKPPQWPPGSPEAPKRSPPGFVWPEIPDAVQALARALDKYLGDNAVEPSKQLKPNTTLATTNSLTVPVGGVLNIKLADDKDTHALKPAKTADREIAVPVANGGVNGYPFRAIGKGNTLVTLIVVHAKTLAVATAMVKVQVVAPPTQSTQNIHGQVVSW